jgi:hypothetical protein
MCIFIPIRNFPLSPFFIEFHIKYEINIMDMILIVIRIKSFIKPKPPESKKSFDGVV